MESRQGHLSRRKFVKYGTAGAASLALGGVAGCNKPDLPLPALIPLSDRPTVDPSKKPNIIFLLSDQHRHDAMGCAGNPVIQTPNLDSMAASGMNFTHTYCASPTCQPSRASLLTGRYPHQNGIVINGRKDNDPNWETMPRQLQRAGYKTALFGKAHFWNMKLGSLGFSLMDWGVDGREKDDLIRAFGFDEVIEEFGPYQHSFSWFNIYTPYSEYLRKRGSLEKYKKQIQSVWRTDPTYWDGQTSVLSQEENQSSFTTRNAINWIKQQDQSRPFYANVSYVAPHVPLISDPIWADYYKDKDIPADPQAFPESPNDLWGEMLKRQAKKSRSHLLSEEYVLNGKRHYYGEISLIDQGIGEIIRTVEEMGIADNTWILYNSDHGDMIGDHRMMSKQMFYHGSVRVPNIIRPPNGMQAKEIDTPVEGIDVTATILDIAGAEPLKESSGQSLLPVIKGETAKKKVAFSAIGPKIDGEIRHFVGAHTRRYRLTYETTTKTPCEFFDLQEDPNELDNKINNPLFTARVKQMIGELILPHMSS